MSFTPSEGEPLRLVTHIIQIEVIDSGRFKEKGPVRSMGALQWRFSLGMKYFFPVEISILVDPKQISVVSKSEREKKVFRHPSLLCHWGPDL